MEKIMPDIRTNSSITLNMDETKADKSDPFSSSLSFIAQAKDASPWKSTLRDLLNIENKGNCGVSRRLAKGGSMVNLKVKEKERSDEQNKAHKKISSALSRYKIQQHLKISTKKVDKATGMNSVKLLHAKKFIKQKANLNGKMHRNSNQQSATHFRRCELDRSDKKGRLADRFCTAKLKAAKSKQQLFCFPDEIINLDKEMIKKLQFSQKVCVNTVLI
eukprot:TRINITY_DN17265_c0_g1_i2.p1 TRINITY_DN17265_c0_g1~~TRINITY_DN17265_c0_g1_i2.p1  ORF type:complete len:218 (+),score=21.40 TRINITY_DN17265_c0_g1_i2:56-709(+)